MGHFEEFAVRGQILDAVAAVTQDASVAIEKRNAADRRSRVGVTLVERYAACRGEQLRDVKAAFLLGANHDRKIKVLAIELNMGSLGRGGLFLQNRAHNDGGWWRWAAGSGSKPQYSGLNERLEVAARRGLHV